MRDQPRAARGEAARVADRVAQLLSGALTEHPARDVPVPRPGDEDDWSDTPDDPRASGPGPSGVRRVWDQLLARVPVRVDPGHRAAWGVGLAVALAAVLTGLWLLSSRPASVPVSARAPHVPGGTLAGPSPSSAARPTPAPTAVAPAASSGPAVVVVDVAGKVARPGLYRLPAGSRVDDALRAAGGARPGVDLTGLNLAAPLADGQQVLVGLPASAGAPDPGPVATAGGAAGAAGRSGVPAGPVNLNTATLDQLDALPGVGPVLAQHILDWRSEHGRFTRVDQLNDVTGVGDVKFADLKALVTV